MATATITLQSACAGGGHLEISVQINGGTVRTFSYDADELRESITAEMIRDTALMMARFHCAGLTRQQARTQLQQGIDVVTS